MKHRSPLVTLTAVALYFVALLIANMVVNPAPSPATTGPASPSGSASAAAPSSAAPSVPRGPSDDQAEDESEDEAEDEAEAVFPDRVVYAGRSENDELLVAVAILGSKAAAYVCDGTEVESWLRGTVAGKDVELIGRDGTTIDARLDDGVLRGDVDLGRDSYDFGIREAEKPAGLYRARGSRKTIGWIVLPDGTQVGLATDGQGRSEPAPALDPEAGSLEVDGEQVTPEPVTGETQI